MLTLKVTIRNSEKLRKTLEKSKQRRYRKLEKNQSYCTKSIERRQQALKQDYPLKWMERGRKRFGVLVTLIKIRLKLCGVRIRKLNTFKRSEGRGPIIFVPTHIGKFDIEVAFACINEHALLLSGTEERMHGSPDGMFLEANRVNYVDRGHKEDRKNSVIKMQRDLKHGFNLLWFIEGTWNLSANRLVYPLSYSVIKLALECNADIVPIAFHQVDRTMYVKFGEVFRPDEGKELTESIATLRDVLATLKWDIYEYMQEKEGVVERSSLTANYWSDFLTDRVEEWPMTDLEEECNYVFQPKEDAYAFFEEFNTRVYRNEEGEEIVEWL